MPRAACRSPAAGAPPVAEPILLSRLLLFLVFIVVPAIEIALFIVVGEMIGVLPTVLLVFVTAFAGVALARRQGFDTVQRLRRDLDQGRMPGEEIGNAITIVIAGLLLLTPGFFTDTLGLLLFVPAVRRGLWRWLRSALKPVVLTPDGRVIEPSGPGSPGPDRPSGPDRPAREGEVIDLEPDEYGPPREDTPWRPDREGR